MSRAALIGGFGASEKMLEPVAKALETHFEIVEDPITLRYAEENEFEAGVLAKNAELFVLSGGIGPAANMRPSALHGLGAALPVPRPVLLWRTAAKQRLMHREDPEKAKEFERLAKQEILAAPFFHLAELAKVARMDALGIADHHQRQGRAATLAFFEDDSYFQLSARDKAWAQNSSLNILHLPGQHDEPILNPQATIDRYLELAG